jgi:hypothetical protein
VGLRLTQGLCIAGPTQMHPDDNLLQERKEWLEETEAFLSIDVCAFCAYMSFGGRAGAQHQGLPQVRHPTPTKIQRYHDFLPMLHALDPTEPSPSLP